jgi:hypothetical protein
MRRGWGRTRINRRKQATMTTTKTTTSMCAMILSPRKSTEIYVPVHV